MITAAHVGVGISGLEGQQAARSADFVIGQFRFLQPLMFVHGREAYRRNAFTVCYIFYKNVLFVLPQFWFGFYSVFSGQTLYEAWIYQMYNIVFTAFPIFWFALFDYEHTKEKFLTKPQYYSIGLRNECFSYSIFWQWVASAAAQSLGILLFCYVVMEITLSANGDTSDLFMAGSLAYAAVVLIASVTILN
jgi:phospholipid-transporting ATPase